MNSLLENTEFWAGALLLCAFQIPKFGEIDQRASRLKGRSAVPDLRASDFLSRTLYLAILMLFLAVTLAGYVALCLLSPEVIGGWMRIFGRKTEGHEIADIVQSAAYPLWIAGAFVGLSHQAIPGLSKISDALRDSLHGLIGIPRYVVDTSIAFSTQILGRTPDKPSMANRLAELCGASWRAEIEPIADIGFFQAELRRLKLDSAGDLAEVLGGSSRELQTSLEQVIYVACIATVRKGGGSALPDLARHLRVAPPPPPPAGILHDLVAPLCGWTAALIVLLFLVPMTEPLAAPLLGGGPLKFWPCIKDGADASAAILASAVYLLGLVVPVLIAAGILASWKPQKKNAAGIVSENIGAWVVVGLFVVGYDLAQTLWDYGFNNIKLNPTTGQFIARMVPFIALHALVVLAICFVIQWRVSRDAPQTGRQWLLDGLQAVTAAAIVSAFYAWARINYQWPTPQPIDLLPLTVLLNGAAAMMAFVAYQSVWRRRQARQERDTVLPAAAD